jgi:chromosomal replication initiation ATPase DnaA
MTPSQVRFIEAKKARDARFAAAALRQIQKEQERAKEIRRAVEEKKIAAALRRQYEIESRASLYTPISQRILQAIAREFDISVSQLISADRYPIYTNARYFAVGLFLELTQMSLPWIGRQLGGRDHTTIIHSRKIVLDLLKSEAIRNRFDQIKAGIVG